MNRRAAACSPLAAARTSKAPPASHCNHLLLAALRTVGDCQTAGGKGEPRAAPNPILPSSTQQLAEGAQPCRWKPAQQLCALLSPGGKDGASPRCDSPPILSRRGFGDAPCVHPACLRRVQPLPPAHSPLSSGAVRPAHGGSGLRQRRVSGRRLHVLPLCPPFNHGPSL